MYICAYVYTYMCICANRMCMIMCMIMGMIMGMYMGMHGVG